MSEAFWTSLKRMKYAIDEFGNMSDLPEDIFSPGSRCDVLDYHMGREVWRTCKVLRTDSKQHTVFVHWEGWGHHWDEWIDLRLGRRVIAPLWSRVPRLSRTGKQCEFAAPLTIGLSMAGGRMVSLAPRGAAFFPTASTVLTTCMDDQREAIIRVYQGERPFADQNKYLGEFRINGLPSGSQGSPQIKVTATLHPDGLLSIRGTCEGSFGSVCLAGLDVTAAPTPEDVEKALAEAQENSEKDETAVRSASDPWEERKCRRWHLGSILRKRLGSDVSDLIDEYDDQLRYSLTVHVASAEGDSGLDSAARIAAAFAFEADDDEEDVALVVPALERLRS